MTADFTSLKIQGKGNKERMIPITNVCNSEFIERKLSTF